MSQVDNSTGLGLTVSTDIGQVGGVGSALAKDTIYQASFDGYIEVIFIGNGGGSASIFVDTVNPPVAEKQRNGGGYAQYGSSPTAVVKKGDYWKVTQSGTLSSLVIRFTPRQ